PQSVSDRETRWPTGDSGPTRSVPRARRLQLGDLPDRPGDEPGKFARSSLANCPVAAEPVCGMSAFGLLPDAAVVHELDLPLDDLLAVLGVLHRRALEVEVLRVDGLRVEDLVELGPDVLEPVVPLGARAVVAQRLDVDHARDVRRAGAVVLPADDPALVVDDVRAAAEGVDGRGLL